MKRFKVIDPSERTETGRYNTMIEVVNDLKSSKRDLFLQHYIVKCLIDEIEIDSDELLEAFDRGERFEDLQFF